MDRLSPAALRLRRLQAAATASAVAALALVGEVALRLAGAAVPWPPALVPAVVLVAVGAAGLAWAGAVHRSWAWTLEADHLRVDRGVVVRRSSLVPRRRVQHVSTRVGPIQRRLGLATVEVHTAGARTPNVAIEHLEHAAADALRAELATGAVPRDVA